MWKPHVLLPVLSNTQNRVGIKLVHQNNCEWADSSGKNGEIKIVSHGAHPPAATPWCRCSIKMKPSTSGLRWRSSLVINRSRKDNVSAHHVLEPVSPTKKQIKTLEAWLVNNTITLMLVQTYMMAEPSDLLLIATISVVISNNIITWSNLENEMRVILVILLTLLTMVWEPLYWEPSTLLRLLERASTLLVYSERHWKESSINAMKFTFPQLWQRNSPSGDMRAATSESWLQRYLENVVMHQSARSSPSTVYKI